MDQFTAHLDRGWDLAQRGDALGAEDSARRAMALEGDSPEAHNLMGYTRALRGDAEEALELYRQAIALDETFLEAILNAAEVCLHPLGDPEAALHFLAAASELAEAPDEHIEISLLKFDALTDLGKTSEAETLAGRLPKAPYENPAHYFLIGRALFESGNHEEAEPLLIEASRLEPSNPEVSYYLGMLRDEQGDSRAASACFLQTRERDLRLPVVPWSTSRENFEAILLRAFEALPVRLRSLVDPAEIYVNDLPGMEIIVEGADPRAALILDPLEGSSVLFRVFVYQRNVERISGSFDRVEETCLTCLEHEIASFALGEPMTPAAEAGSLN